MARIFLSHSAANNSEASALCGWLSENGWNEIFLDLDPERGLKAGQRWQEELKRAAERCEAVICLISPAWCESKWCLLELMLARNLSKRIFGVIIVPTPFSDLPQEITGEWQIVNLTDGVRDHEISFESPNGGRKNVMSTTGGLERLRLGLLGAGLEAHYFNWPPDGEPFRAPYRGLRPLEATDAGIFFGRDGLILKAIDALRKLKDAASPRIFVVLGASGSGKSSFLRAGLWPRLKRDDTLFLPLPVMRPLRGVLFGEAGLLTALENAVQEAKLSVTRADLRKMIASGVKEIAPLLAEFIERIASRRLDGLTPSRSPTLVMLIDQSEELFRPESTLESHKFLELLRDIIDDSRLDLLAIFTIRSDTYERLQVREELEGLGQETFGLPPMPKGSYAEVIKGPPRWLDGTPNALSIDDRLVDALLTDIEAGAVGDVLPLLAFTLERLYEEYHAGGALKLEHYQALGRLQGSIEAAVDRAFAAADMDSSIPRARQVRLDLLRRGLIPHLASIDLESGAAVRRVARFAEIPSDSRPLIRLLIEERLLSTDIAPESGEITVEPVHEAILRQWNLLKSWLAEDGALLRTLDGVKRASREWADHDRSSDWLIHSRERLILAEQIVSRTDLAVGLDASDHSYLTACRNAGRVARTRQRLLYAVVASLCVVLIGGLAAWLNRSEVELAAYRFFIFRPFVLSSSRVERLKPLETFKECFGNSSQCPEMVVIPAGHFVMGSEVGEQDRGHDEGPTRQVVVGKPFAASKFDITFDQWEACADHGPCAQQIRDYGWGRKRQPVISVSWNDAKTYVSWLSEQTGGKYRLLTEAEWEYLARLGNSEPFDLAKFAGSGMANCDGCGSKWDSLKPAPVGSFPANALGLFDLQGNVWQWLEDCWTDGYDGAPSDASAVERADCKRRVLRGGAWNYELNGIRPAFRYAKSPLIRDSSYGFRVARDLL